MHEENILKSEPNFHIFNLYCFLNYSGYNDENNKVGMHAVRNKLRSELENNKKLLNSLEYKDYYNKYYLLNKVHLYHFNKYALSLKSDSSFSLESENYSTKLLPEFNQVLKAFSEETDSKNLWKNYLVDHQIICDKYNLVNQKVIKQTKDCFITKENKNTNIVIIPNLLESYYRNKSIQIGNCIYLVIGPYKNEEPHIEGVIHEYIHTIVNPIVEKLKDKIEQHSDSFEIIPKTPQIIGSYNNWTAYFNECLVRSLAIVVYAKIENDQKYDMEHAKNNLIDQGFLLTSDFIKLVNKYDFPLDLLSMLTNYLDSKNQYNSSQHPLRSPTKQAV